MAIQLAQKSQVFEIMDVIEMAKARLKVAGIDQWQTGYPLAQDIVLDIEQEAGYVLLKQGHVIGYFMIEISEVLIEPFEKSTIATLHRLAIHDDYVKQGLSDVVQDFFEKTAQTLNITQIRVDTHVDNQAMLAFIKRNKYEFIGTIRVQRGELRQNYEKQITKIIERSQSID